MGNVKTTTAAIVFAVLSMVVVANADDVFLEDLDVSSFSMTKYEFRPRAKRFEVAFGLDAQAGGDAKAPTLSDRSLAPCRQSLAVGNEPFDGFAAYDTKSLF